MRYRLIEKMQFHMSVKTKDLEEHLNYLIMDESRIPTDNNDLQYYYYSHHCDSRCGSDDSSVDPRSSYIFLLDFCTYNIERL